MPIPRQISVRPSEIFYNSWIAVKSANHHHARLLHILNTRRASIQHAADAIWPHSQEANRPIRKTFGLPLTRAMEM